MKVDEYGGGIRGPTTEEWNYYAEKIAETEGYDDVDSMHLPEGVILSHQDFIVPMYEFGGFGLERACENAIRKYNLILIIISHSLSRIRRIIASRPSKLESSATQRIVWHL